MAAEPGFHVDYSHDAARHAHTVEGAREVLRTLFPDAFPQSVLDVGCGRGTWLEAALERGASDLLGIEGADLAEEALSVPGELVRREDLNRSIRLGRQFDLVLCLETAEHLEPKSAATIIETLTAHGPTILFSAAVPGQPGIHHANCQWPAYWQQLFNERGYACSDAVRWALWGNDRVEPWYRQNMMTATKDEAAAGQETRILPVVHPDMLAGWDRLEASKALIETGALPMSWYGVTALKAAMAKLRRLTRPENR